MIQTIPQITINGSNSIWNGYIYNLNYQPSFGQTPSYATVSLISEDGTYSIQNTDLQVNSIHTINIGSNITLQMYPVNYKFSQSSSGKILEVRYEDTSIMLDRKIVVLNGRQGNNGTAFPINPFGTAPTYTNDLFVGSCYIPLGRELITVNETYNDVLNVVYSFAELCNGIGFNGIVISSDSYSLIQNSNQFYYASYIGTLRNVLSQWCTDLGYGFYWENNQLHFLDLTTALVLNTSAFDNAAQEAQTTEVSIEDTVGRVACAFYGQAKQFLGPSPSQDTTINFTCVTMAQVGFTPDQISSIKAAYLGRNFYDAYHFWMNNTYGNTILGLVARTNAVTGKETQSSQNDDPTNPKFNDYYYVAQDATSEDIYWNFYSELLKYVGKFYYLPMTHGDFRVTKFDNSPQFYKADAAVSTTSLAAFASLLNLGDQTLQDFLLGNPFSVYSELGETDPNILNNTYDSENGYAIAVVNNPGWYLNGVLTSPNAANQVLIQQSCPLSYPVEITLPNNTLGLALTADNPFGSTQVNNIISQSSAPPYAALYLLKMWGVITPLYNSKNFDLSSFQSPEDISDIISVIATITNENENVLPKIEEYFRSQTDKNGVTVDCHSNVIKNEMNFRNITEADLTALGKPAWGFLGTIRLANGTTLVMPSVPTNQNLEEIFQLFSQNLTFSKVDPTIVKTYSLPYIDLPNNYQPLIGNGLINLEISMTDKGVNSNYTMGTRLMQIPSLESIRMNLEFQRRTNESRFLPYGYQPVVLL